jgi:hypothetical protein
MLFYAQRFSWALLALSFELPLSLKFHPYVPKS